MTHIETDLNKGKCYLCIYSKITKKNLICQNNNHITAMSITKNDKKIYNLPESAFIRQYNKYFHYNLGHRTTKKTINDDIEEIKNIKQKIEFAIENNIINKTILEERMNEKTTIEELQEEVKELKQEIIALKNQLGVERGIANAYKIVFKDLINKN